jgi:hypothetical protein
MKIKEWTLKWMSGWSGYAYLIIWGLLVFLGISYVANLLAVKGGAVSTPLDLVFFKLIGVGYVKIAVAMLGAKLFIDLIFPAIGDYLKGLFAYDLLNLEPKWKVIIALSFYSLVLFLLVTLFV